MAVSRDHHEFDTSSNIWTLNKDVLINLDDVLDLLAKPLQEPYRHVMKFHAENFAPWYCFNIHLRVRQGNVPEAVDLM